MYGGAFKQNYGWYINKQAFEWGVAPLNRLEQFLPEACPDELLVILKDCEFKKVGSELRWVNQKLFEISQIFYADKYKNSKEEEKEKWKKIGSL